MSIIFSRQCEYALRAVVYLAVRQPGELISIGEVATDLKIPVHFLAKIFQDLSKKQLLYSKKGPGGGFRLGVPAKEITLFHIVEAIDGVSFMENCIMGFSSCSVKNPCPMHAGWGSLRDSLYRMLANKSIERLAKEIQVKPEYRKFP